MSRPSDTRDDGVERLPIKPRDRLAVEHRGGRRRAMTETIDGLDRYRAARGRVDLQSVRVRQMRDERLATDGLTGFGPAELQHGALDQFASIVVIKADDADRF